MVEKVEGLEDAFGNFQYIIRIDLTEDEPPEPSYGDLVHQRLSLKRKLANIDRRMRKLARMRVTTSCRLAECENLLGNPPE